MRTLLLSLLVACSTSALGGLNGNVPPFRSSSSTDPTIIWGTGAYGDATHQWWQNNGATWALAMTLTRTGLLTPAGGVTTPANLTTVAGANFASTKINYHCFGM